MRVKSELLRGVGVFFAALSLPSVTVAQEISYPDSLRQRPKIYSPYVERTAADADFAEGVYWGDTHLDRIQIIKGWIDDNGERQERVYDVAVSDGRTIGSDGRCRTPVGNTVNVADASYLNNIGDAELRAVWTDPDFNPNHRAFYYARVLEIPTPTWQAYDSKFYGITMPETVQMFGQERAYTSPIWYTP